MSLGDHAGTPRFFAHLIHWASLWNLRMPAGVPSRNVHHIAHWPSVYCIHASTGSTHLHAGPKVGVLDQKL
eukprot:1628521-Pleurochrysis_carterae.AAC.1